MTRNFDVSSALSNTIVRQGKLELMMPYFIWANSLETSIFRYQKSKENRWLYFFKSQNIHTMVHANAQVCAKLGKNMYCRQDLHGWTRGTSHILKHHKQLSVHGR